MANSCAFDRICMVKQNRKHFALKTGAPLLVGMDDGEVRRV